MHDIYPEKLEMFCTEETERFRPSTNPLLDLLIDRRDKELLELLLSLLEEKKYLFPAEKNDSRHDFINYFLLRGKEVEIPQLLEDSNLNATFPSETSFKIVKNKHTYNDKRESAKSHNLYITNNSLSYNNHHSFFQSLSLPPNITPIATLDSEMTEELAERMRAEEEISLSQWLRGKIRKDDSVSADNFNKVLAAYDVVADCEDELSKLVLENCAVDALLHKLKIEANPSARHELSNGHYAWLETKIVLSTIHEKLSQTILHECSHAVCAFAFLMPQFRQLTDAKSVLPFLKAAAQFMHQPVPMALAEKFNPAWHKFRECVRRDQAVSDYAKVLFSHIKKEYKTEILESAGLTEIFSFYMATRLALFLEYGKEKTNQILEEKMPHLHAYFEFDLKKILRARLEAFRTKFASAWLTSSCLPPNETHTAHCEYNKNTGNLRFVYCK